MKFLFIYCSVAILALAGCSAEEEPAGPAISSTEDAPVVESTTDVTPPADEALAESERPQALEESGGEPDASEAGEHPIVLAKADMNTAVRDWQFQEGKHFHRLIPTQPTLSGADKVEVAEFFWYGCGHCYEFEPYVNRWTNTMPPSSRFVRIPATWNPLVKLHAQLYYTEEVLVGNGKISDPVAFRAAVFAEYHNRGNRLTSLTAIQELFVRFGVNAEEFDSTWASFEVAQKLRVAQDLSRRYAISGVPAMVVNGKYRTGKAETGSYPRLLEVIDELIERETIR